MGMDFPDDRENENIILNLGLKRGNGNGIFPPAPAILRPGFERGKEMVALASLPLDVPPVRPNDAEIRARRVFGIKALSDAATLPRILGIFAQRDVVPREMSCSRAGAYLLINLEIEALTLDTAEALLAKLRQVMLVERAHLAGPSPWSRGSGGARAQDSQGVGQGRGSGLSLS
jgi:putative lipoic acid-binding regulatory protein